MPSVSPIGGRFPDDPERELTWVERRALVVEMRAQGRPIKAISSATGWSVDYVQQLLREAADHVRAETEQFCRVRFMEADARCEYLYEQVQRRLSEADAEDTAKYAALVRAAISVMERQARLWNLDREKVKGVGGRGDWLEEASPAELRRIAEAYDLDLHPAFK